MGIGSSDSDKEAMAKYGHDSVAHNFVRTERWKVIFIFIYNIYKI